MSGMAEDMSFSGQVNCILDPDAIRYLKEGLVSRESDTILNMVNIVLNLSRDNDVLDGLMRTDIPTLVSEAIAPGHTEANIAIYRCLQELSRHQRFCKDGHADLVTLSTCRSISFLIKETDCSELHGAMGLLAHVLFQYNTFGFSPDRKLLEQVNDTIKMFRIENSENAITRFLTSLILKALLDNKILKLRESSVRTLFENVEHCFQSMLALIQSPNADAFIKQSRSVTSGLAVHICRMVMNHDTCDDDKKQETISSISAYLINIALPQVLGLPLHILPENSDFILPFLQCLNLLLKGSNASSSQLGHVLCANGILPLFPSLINLQMEGNAIRQATIELLATLLVWLSICVFDLSVLWKEGIDHFAAEVEAGTRLLPSDWLTVLCDPSFKVSTQVVVLLYLYFSKLVDGRCEDMSTLSAVSTFLHLSSGVEISQLLVKTLWFILALSHVQLAAEGVIVQDVEQAVTKLTDILKQQEDLEIVYTHHPSIIYHAFLSSSYSTSLQRQIVKLWLSHQTEDQEDFSEFLCGCESARFAVLDLIQSENDPVLTSAFEAFKALILGRNGQKQAATVWKVLPDALVRVCGQPLWLVSLQRIAELAILCVPDDRDSLQLTRIANLLPMAIANIEVVPLALWVLAHTLLKLHIDDSDYGVVTMYSRCEHFMKKLFGNFNSQAVELIPISLKLAGLLCSAHRESKLPPVFNSVKLDLDLMLTLLRSHDISIRSAALLFIQELFEAQWTSSVCQLGELPSGQWVSRVFIQIQNICVMDGFDEVWECLTSLLQLYPRNHELAQHMLTSPSILLLLQTALPKLCTQQSVANFATTWLSLHEPIVPSSRCLALPYCTATIVSLAETALQNFHPGLLPLLTEIYESGARLPEQIQENIFKLLHLPPLSAELSGISYPQRIPDISTEKQTSTYYTDRERLIDGQTSDPISFEGDFPMNG